MANAGKRPEVIVYTKPFCAYCEAAKSLLSSKGVSFSEIDVSRDDTRRAEMTERSGARTVPQIFIDGRAIGGFEDLTALDADGGLDRLLGIGGP